MILARQVKTFTKGGGLMEMPTTSEYLLRLILELIDKCKDLDELREAVKKVLQETK